MKPDDRLLNEKKIPGEALATVLPELDDLRSKVHEGAQLLAEQQESLLEGPAADKAKLKKRLRIVLEAFGMKPQEAKPFEPENRKSAGESDARQHEKLLQALRYAVYDSDLKIPGRSKAIQQEVDEALTDLIKGGAFDDRKLAQVVEELYGLEGKAASGATLGRFAAQEVPPAELPDDDGPDSSVSDPAVTAVGGVSQQEKEREKIKILHARLIPPADDDLGKAENQVAP